jgi:hypothetical protein
LDEKKLVQRLDVKKLVQRLDVKKLVQRLDVKKLVQKIIFAISFFNLFVVLFFKKNFCSSFF